MRVSGPRTRELAARLVRHDAALRPRYATYATIVSETGRAIDRGLALFFPAPHSYTGEDALELQTHGSPVVAREIVRALLACGARMAQPGEFTRRAFLNGKMDLHAAAAVADLIEAESSSAARAALANLGGGLANEVRSLRSSLAAVLEELAGAIDFPDEVPEPDRPRLEAVLGSIAGTLEALRRDGELGRLVREGVDRGDRRAPRTPANPRCSTRCSAKNGRWFRRIPGRPGIPSRNRSPSRALRFA